MSSNIMAVILDGIAQLEYDRNKPLPDHQALYLDKMDQKMDEGIQVGASSIPNPDLNDRAQFIAANLANAIINNDEAMSSALCSYLAIRIPELKQVKILNENGEISIDLVFDEEYAKQIPVKFVH